MSMTREEAITCLQEKYDYCKSFYDLAAHPEEDYPEMTKYLQALQIALAALRPVSREQVEKAWMGCKYCDEEWGTCNPITNRFTMPPRGGIRFCPMCGRPLTDEAVEMVMERWEALDNETQ